MRMEGPKDMSQSMRPRCKGTEKELLSCELLSAACPWGELQAAGVRCTNFLPEDQPTVLLSGLELPLTSEQRLSCKAVDSLSRPSFNCSVEALQEDSCEGKRST